MLAELLLTGEEVSISGLAERVGLAYATVHREVDRLVEAEILGSRTVGATRLIFANPDSPLTSPLRQVLAIAAGPVPALSEEFAQIQGIVSAFVYGSFAERAQGISGPAPADLDVMVIGEPDPSAVFDACARVEKLVHRPVNPTIYSEAEFAQDSGFLATVRTRPILPILGELQWD